MREAMHVRRLAGLTTFFLGLTVILAPPTLLLEQRMTGCPGPALMVGLVPATTNSSILAALAVNTKGNKL